MSLNGGAPDRWEGLTEGYLPPPEPRIEGDLALHEEHAEQIDPITFEVVRSKLWNLNWDHQETIRRTSGSLVVIQSYDFNTSIQTERGEGVVFGPGNWFFAGSADLVVNWTLEHRSGNVGIGAGDIFIQNDPWVGTNHSMDTAVYRPVFVDGRLFAWVYNVTHQRELGGVEPGGFVQSAEDVYSEATFWPPVKLGEDGVAREDLMEAWVRRSRLSNLMAIELRAQLAGVHLAHERLLDIVERYGASVVKGVMRRTIATTAETVGRRLAAIPDGTWRDERYVAGASPGDRRLHRLALTFRKRGDRLAVSNRGTGPATGSFNITRGVLRACVTSALLHFLAWDQQLCGAGVLRQLDFEFADDAINSARHPHAVSTSLGLCMTLNQAHHLGAKLVSGSTEAGRHSFASSGEHTLVTNHVSGVDQYGNPFAHFPFDGTTGAIGAFSFRDGIDHGGTSISTINPVGSVEAYEQEIPFLYLYRREVPGSGGDGRWRGGSTFVSAWTGHGSDDVGISSGGLFQSVTQGLGLEGGRPSTGGTMWHAEGTAVLDELAAGRLPADPPSLRELAPDGAPPPPKKFDNRLRPGDLFETMPQPGAGFGDPVTREPERVAADVAAGTLDAPAARATYGVVLTADGDVDEPGTADERAGMRQRRLRAGRAPRRPREGHVEPSARATAGVAAGYLGGMLELACAGCGQALGRADSGYRGGCRELEIELADLGPHFQDPRTQVSDELVLREYMCPSCGVVLDTELCRPDDEPFVDLTLASEGAGEGIDGR